MSIAPTAEKRAKFQIVADAARTFSEALVTLVQGAETNSAGDADAAALANYEAVAEHLNESAEDGEMAGRDASQTSLGNVEKISKDSVPLVIGVSVAGFFVALAMSLILSRAILLPVQHLKQVAENVSVGNLQMSVKRFSNDEIGDLADSFSRMVTAVRFFQSEAEASQAQPVAEPTRR